MFGESFGVMFFCFGGGFWVKMEGVLFSLLVEYLGFDYFVLSRI